MYFNRRSVNALHVRYLNSKVLDKNQFLFFLLKKLLQAEAEFCVPTNRSKRFSVERDKIKGMSSTIERVQYLSIWVLQNWVLKIFTLIDSIESKITWVPRKQIFILFSVPLVSYLFSNLFVGKLTSYARFVVFVVL